MATDVRSRAPTSESTAGSSGIVTDVNDPDGPRAESRSSCRGTRPAIASGRASRQLYAGPGYGSTWVPEVDGEVLVLFAHGDMRWPLRHRLPLQPGRPAARVAQRLERRANAPARRTARSSASTRPTRSSTLKTQSGASVELDEQSGELTLEATSKITLKAADISIEATGSVTVKGSTIALN